MTIRSNGIQWLLRIATVVAGVVFAVGHSKAASTMEPGGISRCCYRWRFCG